MGLSNCLRWDLCLLVLFFTAGFVTATEHAPDSTIAACGFESRSVGVFKSLDDESGRWEAVTGRVEVTAGHARTGHRALRLSGEHAEVVWEPVGGVGEPYALTFWAERWSGKGAFKFRVEGFDGDGWRVLYVGDEQILVGGYKTRVVIPLDEGMPGRVRFVCDSEPAKGVLIDDVRISRRMRMAVRSVTGEPTGMPVLIGNRLNPVLRVAVDSQGQIDPLSVTGITLRSDALSVDGMVESVTVYTTGGRSGLGWRDPGAVFYEDQQFGEVVEPGGVMRFAGDVLLRDGVNYFWVSLELKDSATTRLVPEIVCESVTFSDGKTVTVKSVDDPQKARASRRVGVALRNTGDDGVASYRIPGLVTTKRGTLIAVYDVRYDGWGDLPGNIDIGMSRSMDGGVTWEPMKIIADMGDDPGRAYDGVGDPAILVDDVTGAVWVAGLWSHGERGWGGSGPGLEPEETGQVVLVKSEDDGVTWSEPVNITKQVKDPVWRLMFQGPGMGITMRDGTLVFPAQFKDAENMPYATVIFSRDRGETWHIGTGAKADTTEAQVVELSDGSLMLNMRDNRGGSRSVCVTKDLGNTWEEHTTSRSALVEPVCQASLIRVDRDGVTPPPLLFSNPAVSDKPRRMMTIKASLDDGETWPAAHHLLIDAGQSAGYSCMTMIDADTVGILYEGSRANMTFLRIPLVEVLGEE